MKRYALTIASFAVAALTAAPAVDPALNSADVLFWTALVTFLVTAARHIPTRSA